jgi:NhaP-type Na+/H+ and K+/H+ antiporter
LNLLFNVFFMVVQVSACITNVQTMSRRLPIYGKPYAHKISEVIFF